MDYNTFSFLGSLLGAVVGGSLALLGSVLTIRAAVRNVENSEIRRQRVQCLSNLCGLRFVIANEQRASNEYRSKFMFEINKIPILWSDDQTVLKSMRDFLGEAKPEKKDERFTALFRSLGKKTNFQIDNLSDDELRKIHLLPLDSQ